MRLLVVSVVSAPSRIRGYLRRFLLEPTPMIFIGAATPDVVNDVRDALRGEDVQGFAAIADARVEMGFRFLYFQMPHHVLADFDGVLLPEDQVVRK